MTTPRADKALALARRMMSSSKFGLGEQTFTRENLSMFNPSTQEYNTTGTPYTYQAYCAPVSFSKQRRGSETVTESSRQLYIALNDNGDIPEINDKVTIHGISFRLGKQLERYDVNGFDVAFLYEIGN